MKLASALPALFSATHEYCPESISCTLVMTRTETRSPDETGPASSL